MKNNKSVKITIVINGNKLNAEEVLFLQEVIESQKIEVESLTEQAKKNSQIKKSFEIISSLAQKVSSTPNFSV